MTETTVALAPNYWGVLGHGVSAIVLYAVIGLVLMLIGFQAVDLTTPGPLRKMVNAGKPNAVIVASAGMVSMALIVVLAIWASSGHLLDGLIASAIYGVAGIAAQVLVMRVATLAIGLDMDRLLQADQFSFEVLVVAAAQIALGMVVAVAIM